VKESKNPNFHIRVYKRGLIKKWQEQQSHRNNTKIADILEDPDEYVNDPTIIFDQDGVIMQVGEAGGDGDDPRFKKIKDWKSFACPDYDTYSNLKQAKKEYQYKRSKFPIVYVQWLEDKERFNGREFEEVSLCNGLFDYNNFREV